MSPYEVGTSDKIATIALPILYVLLLLAPGIIKYGQKIRAAVVLGFFMLVLPGLRTFAWLAGAEQFSRVFPVRTLNATADLLTTALIGLLLLVSVARQKGSPVLVVVLLIGWSVGFQEAGVHPIDVFIWNLLFEMLGVGTFLLAVADELPI